MDEVAGCLTVTFCTVFVLGAFVATVAYGGWLALAYVFAFAVAATGLLLVIAVVPWSALKFWNDRC